ncbi:MAG: diguanylate cyclase [Desulfobulbus sp.]|nr:diguanylate cyclase [Desulfobulbus sp.]
MPVTLRKALSHHIIFLVLIVLATVSVCLSTAFVIDRQRRAAISEGLELSSYHARNFEEQLTRSLDSVRRMADFIAAGRLDHHGEQVNELLNRLLRQTPFVRSLSAIDEQGRIVASSTPKAIGRHLDLDDYFPHVSVSGTTPIRIGRPWSGRDLDQGQPTVIGQPLAVNELGFVPVLALGEYNGNAVRLVAALNSDYFINYYSQWLEASGGLIEILRYDRLVLLTTGNTALPGTVDADPLLVDRLRESEIGQYRGTGNGQGTTLTAYRASRQFPLLVMIHITQEQMLANWRQESIRTVIMVGMILVILLYLATTFYRREHRLLAEQEAARKREYERLAATVFETVLEAVMVTDGDQHIIAVNPAFTRITGYTPEEAIGADFGLLASGYHTDAFYQNLQQSLTLQGHWEGEVRNRRKSGEIFVAWLSINQVLNDEGQVLYLVSGFSDITEYCAEAERISHLAHHDLLTGLPNRALLMDRLRQGVRQAHRERSLLALIFFDLDKFKPVNDTLGHPVGDRLLQALATRLSRELRASDTLARLGGDEFVLLLPNIKDCMDALKVAEKIRQSVALPFCIEGHQVQVSSSIGVALYPDHGADERALMQCADRAMYRAKAKGGDQFELFDGDCSQHQGLEATHLSVGERDVGEKGGHNGRA